MIQIDALSKSYGNIQALSNVTLQIQTGEIVGLLGPNGAGKTTLIKILTGYLQPDEGSATINGLDIIRETNEVQTIIGYLPENAPLYPELSVQEYLLMISDLREIPEEEQIQLISDAVHAVRLQDVLIRPIGQLSKGMRQRVGLAQAILHKPQILILDEPTVGLDPTQIIEIRELIRRLRKDSTILFSTHILPEVEALCDRVVIIMNGEIKADARLSELAATNNAVLILEKELPDVVKTLRSLDAVKHVQAQRNEQSLGMYFVEGKSEADLTPQIYQLAIQNNWPLRELRRDVRTLEAVFNELAIAG